MESQPGGAGSLALILGIAHLYWCDPAVWNHALRSNVWVGCLTTGSRVSHASVSHLKLSRPVIRSHILKRTCQWGACFYDFCIRLTESYFFVTLGFSRYNPGWRAMARMTIPKCHEKLFGDPLRRNHASFTGPQPFFLDAFLWYIIWNTVYTIARSLMRGLLIWTPWRDIYTRLLKHRILVPPILQHRWIQMQSFHLQPQTTYPPTRLLPRLPVATAAAQAEMEVGHKSRRPICITHHPLRRLSRSRSSRVCPF